jgi:hypothetical protein
MKPTLTSLVLASLILATTGTRGGAEEAAGNEPDETVKQALEAAGIPCTNDREGNFLVNVKFKTGRGQKLVILNGLIALGEEDHGDEMREIYSIAFTSNEPPSGELAAKLLMASGAAKLGGWAVRKSGEEYETVYRAFVPANICEEELMPAMALVATQADALEKSQTGKDEN